MKTADMPMPRFKEKRNARMNCNQWSRVSVFYQPIFFQQLTYLSHHKNWAMWKVRMTWGFGPKSNNCSF